jgi:hypothetical protein
MTGMAPALQLGHQWPQLGPVAPTPQLFVQHVEHIMWHAATQLLLLPSDSTCTVTCQMVTQTCQHVQPTPSCLSSHQPQFLNAVMAPMNACIRCLSRAQLADVISAHVDHAQTLSSPEKN